MKRLKSLLSVCAALVLPVLASAMTNEESVRELRLKEFVLPEFPSGMVARSVTEGEAIVACSYDAQGRPLDILVLDSSRQEFGDAAAEAMEEWRFIPPATETGPRRAMLVRFIFRKQGVILSMNLQREIGVGKHTLRAEPSVYRPLSFEELDAVPKLVSQPAPVSKGQHEPGTVEVSFFVDEKGRVRLPVVKDSPSASLADAAIKTIAQWRFEAPRMQGRPTIAYQTMSLSFGPVTRS